ncbi:MAG: hypothetical protein LBT42_06540 [Tannerella sp.]|nr:hypothetical protein [Tannerella sp.]
MLRQTASTCPSLRACEAIQHSVYHWIASFLAMTASVDGKCSGFLSSFFVLL